MRRWKVLVMLVMAGSCSSINTSTLDGYVRDVQPAYGGVMVTRCSITYTVEHSFSFFEGCIGSSSDSKETTLHEGNCMQQFVPTGGAR